MVSPYAPPGETEATLTIERSSLGGFFVKCTLYGFEICLYLMTIQIMRRNRVLRRHLQTVIFITWAFLLVSIHIGGALKAGVMDFVDNRAYPGGPLQWSKTHYYVTPNALAGTCGFILYASSNAYLMFRFYIIYGSRKLYLLLPMAMWCVTVSFSILLTLHLFRTQDTLIQGVNTNLSLIFYSLDVGLNVILTLLIVARILYTKATVSGALPPEFSKTYSSVAAMMIESSALFSIFSITFIACLEKTTPGATIMVSTLTPLAAISPTLIAYRVANGESWNSDNYPFTSGSLSFAHSTGVTSGSRTVGDASDLDRESTGKGSKEDLEKGHK